MRSVLNVVTVILEILALVLLLIFWNPKEILCIVTVVFLAASLLLRLVTKILEKNFPEK